MKRNMYKIIKKVNQHWVILGLLMIFSAPVLGQEFTEIKRQSPTAVAALAELRLGDSLPDFLIPNLINSDGRPVRTGDFSDRLLLLDFWSVTCSGCVAAMPKMAALQKQFGSRIKVLPVNQEERGRVAAFWKSSPYTRSLKLPSVVEDTLLSAYFRHRYLPHEVWVYKGKVIGITGADYVDAGGVQKVLSGERMSWPLKNDFYKFDQRQTLFTVDTTQFTPGGAALDYAAISGYQRGVNSDGLSGGMGIVRDPAKKTVRLYMLNTALYTAYVLLSNGAREIRKMIRPTVGLSPNQVVWEVADRDRFEYRGKALSGYQQDWIPVNAFCFESIHADTGQSDQQVYRKGMEELNGLFGLNVGWRRRREKVYVMKKDVSGPKVQALKTGLNALSLVNRLNQNDNSPYVFEESGSEALLPEELLKLKDFTELGRALKPYGLLLVQQEREVDKLVFAESTPLLPDGKLSWEYQRRKGLEKTLRPVSPEENTAFLEHNKKLPGVITLPSGLQYKVLRKGGGKSPLPASKIRVHYTGMQVNGKIFESTLENGIPKVLRLSDMIPGWVQALPLMCEGDKWMLYLPSSLAYGSRTGGGMFPANSTLIFELELIRVMP
jgi:thiol-disulfide isomerase/thioredoxin